MREEDEMIEGVRVVTEGARGCGYRKAGGIYLVSDGISTPCPALPLEMSTCPCCGAGVKPARGFAWFSPARMFHFPCPLGCDRYREDAHCGPFTKDRAGIVWVGGRYYPTPCDWTREACGRGVSRRIAQVPRDLVLGKTWVFVAHREAIVKTCACATSDAPQLECEDCGGTGQQKFPGVFHAFCPTRIEQVVTENIPQKVVDKLLARGITPVVVHRVDAEGRPVDEQGDEVEDEAGA